MKIAVLVVSASLAVMSETTQQQVFEMLTSGDDGRVCRDIPDSACREEAGNFFTHVASL